MPVIFLTSASTSPWSRPSDWTDAGHTVELVGAGGQSGAASTGTSGRGGAGGGGGAYGLLTRTSGALAATTAFAVKANNTTASQTTNATCWEAAVFTTSYYAGPGQPGVTTTAGAAGAAATVNGSPAVVYTITTARAGGAGGAASTTVLAGGAGGGGAGGPTAAGGAGGATSAATGTVGGAGGGAANNGVTGVGASNTSGAAGTAGGTGVGPSHGGGAGSSSTTSPGNGSAGVGGQGGGGGASSGTTTTGQFLSGYAGGPNGNTTDWVGFLVTGTTQAGTTSNIGAGAGAGGGGGASGNVTITSAGGAGGNYGGGGGGPGATRGTNSGGVGTGASGLIVITYTSGGAPTLWQAVLNPWTGAGSLAADITRVPAAGAGAGSSVTFSNNVLHYTFDADSLPAVTDTSGNSNTGTLQGSGTTAVAGKVGTNALSFNGSGYISLTSASLLGIPTATSEFSASCWINCIPAVATAAIFEFRDASGNGILHFGLGYNGAGGNAGAPSILLRSNDGSGLTQLLSTTDISDNNWHHIAFTRTSGKLVTIYIDGVSDCSVTDTLTTALTPLLADANIGKDVLNAGITQFLGSLDDVQVYSRALTSTEINTIYVAGITPPAPPVQFMYTKRRFVFWRR